MPKKTSPAAIFLVAGASCAGKDTLVSRLLKEREDIAKVVTTTTRPAREGEENGKAYHFISRAEFETKRNNGDFLESADVHGQLYGTTLAAINDIYVAGKMPVAIMDVQGIEQAQQKLPVTTVFITASLETIASRMALVRPADQVAKRMESAKKEIEIGMGYDHVVVNEDGEMERAVKNLVQYYDTVVRMRLARYKQEQEEPKKNRSRGR